MTSRLFSAQLRYWRSRLGVSQLDLSHLAGVSARHISFLESGRANPSEEMVLRISAVLNVPLRQQNVMLRDAGYAPRFPDSDLDGVPTGIRFAIERMLEKQEPYPMTVLNSSYDIIASNKSSQRFLAAGVSDQEKMTAPLNVFSLVFDPQLMRPRIKNWEDVAKMMLMRLQREVLQHAGNADLKSLLARVMQYPAIPEDWQSQDLATLSEPKMVVILKHMGDELRFFTTTTRFTAPRHTMLEELQLESYFPLDEQTGMRCEGMALGCI